MIKHKMKKNEAWDFFFIENLMCIAYKRVKKEKVYHSIKENGNRNWDPKKWLPIKTSSTKTV
jgi:hypothetical protein